MGQFNDYDSYRDFVRICEANGIPVPQHLVEEGERLRREEEELNGTPIYATFQRSSSHPYSDELKECIRETVDALMDGGMDAQDPVLLLGNVQCGKTNTFENVMALAMDRGIDVCIVLTKGTNALVAQTIERAKHDFREFKEKGKLGETIIEVKDAIKMSFLSPAEVNNKNKKYIIVCKKQTDNLDHMIQMFQQDYMKDVKLLIVDDEADFASRNYEVTYSHSIGNHNKYLELAKIANQIEQLIKLPKYCRYLQVTATPYSMLLQPDGSIELKDGKASSFKPRFISEVPVHSRYVGGKQYYEESQYDDSMYSHIYCETTEKAIEILKTRHASYLSHGIHSTNAADVIRFFINYLVSTAVRTIQSAKKGASFNSSAMVHCDTRKDLMLWQSELLKKYCAEITEVFGNGEKAVENDAAIGLFWNEIYDDLSESAQKGVASGLLQDHYFPTKSEIYQEVRSMLDNREINIQIVNSDNDVSALLNSDGQLRLSHKANLFIGGFNLDRGVTIDHLLCVFYGRNPGTAQQNTVLQHARWYGARPMEDMAVTRFYTSREIQETLVKVNDLDNQMRVWLRAMKKSDNPASMPYFVGYDKGIKPCSSQQIIPSNTFTINGHKRLLPIGFQTRPKYALMNSKVIEQIETLITTAEGYKKDECFIIDVKLAKQILDLIYSSFDIAVPTGCDKEILTAILSYATGNSGGRLYCLHRRDREMSRKTKEGRFISAPDDGRTDIPYARSMAVDMPVLTLLGQKGREEDGWRGHPFYWPVLMTQENLTSAIFTCGASFDMGEVTNIDVSRLTRDTPPEKILELSINYPDFKSYLKETLDDGTILDEDLKEREVYVKDGSFAKYLQIDPVTNRRMLIPEVKESDLQAGIFSYNGGTFPFILREYDYILFTIGGRKSAKGWLFVKLRGTDVEAYDCDPEEDTLIDDDGNRLDYVDENMATWCIDYHIEKVVGWINFDENGNEELKLF